MPHNAQTQINEKINDNINVNTLEAQKSKPVGILHSYMLLVSRLIWTWKPDKRAFLCIFHITIYPQKVQKHFMNFSYNTHIFVNCYLAY